MISDEKDTPSSNKDESKITEEDKSDTSKPRTDIVEDQEEKKDTNQDSDWMLARRGIRLVLNNQFQEALKCFENRDQSIQLAAGYSYVVFLTAIMTFEEDKVNEAMEVLKDLEKRCAQELGWMKSVRRRLSSSSPADLSSHHFEEEIVLADCQVCLAFLVGITSDTTASYVKSGWTLRKAWRIYQNVYNRLLPIYKKTYATNAVGGVEIPALSLLPNKDALQLPTPESPTCPWSFPESMPSPSEDGPTTFWRIFNTGTCSAPENTMPALEVSRLMSAVSFGYGLFRLVVSLLPPPMLKLMRLFGFSGHLEIGLEALMFSRLGVDMRAPLATLTLLWYHTIVRPFYAIDCQGIQKGTDTASALIDEIKEEFGNSAIFLFFQGRILRLTSKISSAVRTYEAVISCSPQKELHFLCLHEIGWCYLSQLQFEKACKVFDDLRRSSKWGHIFYSYCVMVCDESINKKILKERLKIKKRIKIRDFDAMILERIATYFDHRHHPFFYRLLAYELLYMWNTLPSSDYISMIIEDCKQNEGVEEPVLGLRWLTLGVCYSCLGDLILAEECLQNVIKMRCQIPISAPDAHVEVFTLFELAVVKIKCEDNEEARTYLNRLGIYRSYDLEHQLSFRVHTALQIVKLRLKKNKLAARRYENDLQGP